MIFITGGEASGKRTYAARLGFDKNDIFDIREHADELSDTDLINRIKDKKVVIANETGSGIIPVNRDEARQRELMGSFSIQAAKAADKVIRMVCGLPVVIKDETCG